MYRSWKKKTVITLIQVNKLSGRKKTRYQVVSNNPAPVDQLIKMIILTYLNMFFFKNQN